MHNCFHCITHIKTLSAWRCVFLVKCIFMSDDCIHFRFLVQMKFLIKHILRNFCFFQFSKLFPDLKNKSNKFQTLYLFIYHDIVLCHRYDVQTQLGETQSYTALASIFVCSFLGRESFQLCNASQNAPIKVELSPHLEV